MNTAKVQSGDNVIVFGLGGIGLNVVQGARMVGANMIVGIDINPKRKAIAEKFGMTHFVDPGEVEGDLVAYLVDLTKCGARSEEHSSELQSQAYIVFRLLLEKKNEKNHDLP